MTFANMAISDPVAERAAVVPLFPFERPPQGAAGRVMAELGTHAILTGIHALLQTNAAIGLTGPFRRRRRGTVAAKLEAIGVYFRARPQSLLQGYLLLGGRLRAKRPNACQTCPQQACHDCKVTTVVHDHQLRSPVRPFRHQTGGTGRGQDQGRKPYNSWPTFRHFDRVMKPRRVTASWRHRRDPAPVPGSTCAIRPGRPCRRRPRAVLWDRQRTVYRRRRSS